MSYYRKKDNFNGIVFLIIIVSIIVFVGYVSVLISDVYDGIKKLTKNHPEIILYLILTTIILGILLVFLLYSIIKLRLKIYKDQVARQKRAEEFNENNPQDKDKQLEFINNEDVTFTSVNPINKELFRDVFIYIDEYLKTNHKSFRIFAETTLGAFIKVTSINNKKAEDLAKASINSKRIDLLIIDYYGHPALAIEYHGTGHNGPKTKDPKKAYLQKQAAEKRDRVKKEALELADIELIVIENKQEEIIEKRTVEIKKFLREYKPVKKS